MNKMIGNGSVEIYAETFGNAKDVSVLLIAGAIAPAIFWGTIYTLTRGRGSANIPR